MSDSLWPHELQHARPPCPSPTPGAYSNSCPLSWWCHPAISSSVVPFSPHLQSFPASGSFQTYTLNSINCTSQEGAALKVPSCVLLLYSSLLKTTMLLGLSFTNKPKKQILKKKKSSATTSIHLTIPSMQHFFIKKLFCHQIYIEKNSFYFKIINLI